MTEKKTDIVFYFIQTHYCRFHSEPWTVMCKGQAYYVNDVTVKPTVGVWTKETPESERNKAAYKTKATLKILTYDNGKTEAVIE